jgi:hypothetical protein
MLGGIIIGYQDTTQKSIQSENVYTQKVCFWLISNIHIHILYFSATLSYYLNAHYSTQKCIDMLTVYIISVNNIFNA